MFAGASPSGIYYTDNEGMNWTHVNSGIISSYTEVLDVKYRSDTVFAATSSGLIYSNDNGLNWYPFTNLYVSTQKIALTKNGDILVSVLNNGIYRSTNGGTTWIPFSEGLTNNNVRSFAFNITNRLYAATDAGVFYTDEYSKGSNSAVDAFTMQQNFPNPFNSTTDILFNIPYNTQVSLKVYNILGQEVVILFDHEFVKGFYQYSWNASQFSSGIYFLRLHSNSFNKTIKTILLK